MSAPTLLIEGIQVFRGWDENRIPGDHSFDNIITWNVPTEAGVTHVEIWATNYVAPYEQYLLATVATDVEQITSDSDIYTILRTGEFQTYSLRAKNSVDGFGPWSNAPRVEKGFDGNPNHPADRNEIGILTGLEVIGGDVKINWTNPGNSPNGSFVNSGARVYRSISGTVGEGTGSAFYVIGNTDSSTFTFTDTTISEIVLPGQIVQYAIVLKDEQGRVADNTPEVGFPFPYLPPTASNIVSWSQNPVTEGVSFLVGFFSGVQFKLQWSFATVHTDTVFEIQRARPRSSGNSTHMTWTPYDSIGMNSAYVGEYLDSNHGLYEFTYPDDTSTQWAFRILALTAQGVEYFSLPFFLAPAPSTFIVSLVGNPVDVQYFNFQISHPAFFPNTDSYYHTMKAYKKVNGGAWSLIWAVENNTGFPDFPGWFYDSTPFPYLGNFSIVFLFPPDGSINIPSGELKKVSSGVVHGTIQFKLEASSTADFNNLTSTSLSEVFTF